MKVTRTLQGQLTDAQGLLPAPVTQVYCRNTNAIGAAAAVTQILAEASDPYVRTLDIHIEL